MPVFELEPMFTTTKKDKRPSIFQPFEETPESALQPQIDMIRKAGKNAPPPFNN